MRQSDSAKQAMFDMMFFYYYALCKEGSVAPKQEVFDAVVEELNLCEEKTEYLKLHQFQGNQFLENLDSSILLLEAMERSKVLDLESIALVKSVLQLFKVQALQTFKSLEVSDE